MNLRITLNHNKCIPDKLSESQSSRPLEAGVWFSRYVIAVMLVDGKQKIPH